MQAGRQAGNTYWEGWIKDFFKRKDPKNGGLFEREGGR